MPVPESHLEWWPWVELKPRVRDALIAADIDTPEKIAKTSINGMVKLAQISRRQAKLVRAVIPYDPDGHPVTMRKQPKGGTLQTGNPKSRGAMRLAVRELCREAFAGRVHVLRKIADDESLPPRDRLRAIDVMAKYGVGTPEKEGTVSIDAVRDLVTSIGQVVEPLVPEEHHERLFEELVTVVKERFPSLA